jgi:hypothetical protein
VQEFKVGYPRISMPDLAMPSGIDLDKDPQSNGARARIEFLLACRRVIWDST